MRNVLRTTHDACLTTPFAVLGIRTRDDALTAVDYLPLDTPPLPPRTRCAERVVALLEAYVDDPGVPFDVALAPAGTPFQQSVWEALLRIPVGTVRRYGDLARELRTAARAVGGACGRNPIALIIPCHRVIASGGELGGFMGGRRDTPLGIKRWLLAHEGALPHG